MLGNLGKIANNMAPAHPRHLLCNTDGGRLSIERRPGTIVLAAQCCSSSTCWCTGECNIGCNKTDLVHDVANRALENSLGTRQHPCHYDKCIIHKKADMTGT